MTSPRGDAPKLDRLITRTIRVSTDVLADRTFRYADLDTDYSKAGSWSVSPTTITMAEKDADDRLLPGVKGYVVDAADVYELAVTGYSRSFHITSYDLANDSWNQPIAYSRRLTFDASEVDVSQIPTDGAMQLIMPPDARQYIEKVVKVWARRTDFEARDLIKFPDTGPVVIEDTRFLVRGTSGPWAEGDLLVDDRGVSRKVRGVSEVGTRGHYLELLARSVGGP